MSVPATRPVGSARARVGLAMILAAIMVAVAACAGSAPSAGASGAAVGAATVGSPAVSAGAGAAAATPVASPSAAPSVSAPSAAEPLPSATALTLAWQKAAPTKADTATYWPAIDPATGDVWVASPWENDFWIFKPDGTFIETWGTAGTGNGQFHLTTHDQTHPDADGAIAFAPDGSFYVADGGNDRIQQFDAHRHFVRAWGSFGNGDGQFTSPKGIATDGKTVFVADDARGDMQTFDATGKHLATFPFPFVLFSLMPNGNLLTGDLEFDHSGKQIASLGVDFAAFGGDPAMAVADKAGNLYVGIQTDGGPVGLVKLDPTGHVPARWTTGAETLALSPDGKSLYMAYTGPGFNGPGWPYLRKYTLP
jgi:hypothetical protein